MAENETAVQENEGETQDALGPDGQPQQEQAYEYPIKVEDAGPGSKKVSVEIPQERIASKLEDQFRELRQQAHIPGFRPGRAPRKLIEKRFSDDVRKEVRRALISESYEQAVEKNKLQVIGEPEFETPIDAIALPDEGAMNYTFSVEVQPQFELPDLAGMKIRKPKITIKDENVDQALNNLREQQGTLIPVEDRGVEAKDYLLADVHLKVDGNVVAHQHDSQIVSRPGRIGGIQIDDLEQRVAGMKAGETRSFNVHAPDTHPNENVKGKDVEVEVSLKDVKRLELAEITPEFLTDLGFDNEQQLRDALREQMEEKINYDVAQAMREQVNRYLLENTNVELPEKLSDRQADRIISRRAVDLMMRGMPREQVEANLERLRGGARDEAVKELKLFFILQKVATEQEVDVNEGELNGRIAMLAAQRGRRPEKMKQEMAKDGTLANLYIQMREQKAIDALVAKAQVEEVEVQPGQSAAQASGTEKPEGEEQAGGGGESSPS